MSAQEEEIITVKGKQYTVKIRVGEVNELTQEFEGVKVFEMTHLTSRNVIYARGVFHLVVEPEETPTKTVSCQLEAEAEFCEKYRVRVINAVLDYIKGKGMNTVDITVKPIMINQFDGTKIL